jgi:hypothetical protein
MQMLKLIDNDNSFLEYIRNYANKLNNVRLTYLEEAGINPKDSTNIIYTYNNNEKFYNYLFKKFS